MKKQRSMKINNKIADINVTLLIIALTVRDCTFQSKGRDWENSFFFFNDPAKCCLKDKLYI